jgi:hypothetical protein
MTEDFDQELRDLRQAENLIRTIRLPFASDHRFVHAERLRRGALQYLMSEQIEALNQKLTKFLAISSISAV